MLVRRYDVLFGLPGVQVVSVELDAHANPVPVLVTAADQSRSCTQRAG